jgi:glutamate-1-semialdehyde 2,1-aminomutase
MFRPKSLAVYEKALQVLPGGVNSPARSFKEVGLPPMIVERGEGATIWDVDGNAYTDYCLSWGTLFFGHAHPEIVQAAVERVKKGSTFGIATEIEQEMASLMTTLVPSLEKIRFVSSGTEATMTAIRLARAFTGRPKLLKFTGHYHGHNDSLLVQAGSGASYMNPRATSKGVNPATVADTICVPFNGEEVFECLETQRDIAAVIVEPVTGNMGVVIPKKGFHQRLEAACRKAGTLLIFDEVYTGFRLGLKGAQGVFGVDPDLSCYSKIIGGGFPVGAVGGKRAIMDQLAPLGEVYQAGTLAGNPVAIAAGLKTLEMLKRPGVYEEMERKVDRFVQPIQAIYPIARFRSMVSLFFGVKNPQSREDLDQLDKGAFRRLFHFLFERGHYLSPHPLEAFFLSMAHTDEQIDATSALIVQFLKSEGF